MENVVTTTTILQSISDPWAEADCGVMIGMGLYVVDTEGCETLAKLECEKTLDGTMRRVDFSVTGGCDSENTKAGSQ